MGHPYLAFTCAYPSSLPLLPSPLSSLGERPVSHLKFKWSGGTTLTRVPSSPHHPHITSLCNNAVRPCGYSDGFRAEHLTQNGPPRLNPGISVGIIGEEGLAPAFGK